jgi:ribosome-associated protein
VIIEYTRFCAGQLWEKGAAGWVISLVFAAGRFGFAEILEIRGHVGGVMLEVNERIQIPEEEFVWSFVRSGGPGGQNVNKVASKAVLHWDLANSPSVPEEVKARLRTLQRRRVTTEGVLVMNSQRFRDQEKNRQDCLDKLRELLLEASFVPKPRKRSKPSRGARERRLQEKRHRAATKKGRQGPIEE